VNAAVKTVISQIARGDIDTAQEAFRSAANKTSVGDIARAVCQATPPPAGTIVVGPALLVWANPFRNDYGWRCGSCRWTASTYKTRRNAEKSANTHAEEHPGIKVRWITRPVGA
jgi:hypothetical protein